MKTVLLLIVSFIAQTVFGQEVGYAMEIDGTLHEINLRSGATKKLKELEDPIIFSSVVHDNSEIYYVYRPHDSYTYQIARYDLKSNSKELLGTIPDFEETIGFESMISEEKYLVSLEADFTLLKPISEFKPLEINTFYALDQNGVTHLDRFWNTSSTIADISAPNKKAFAVSPQGQLFLADNDAKVIQIMDAKTFELQDITRFPDYISSVRSMCFSNADKLLLATSGAILELDIPSATFTEKLKRGVISAGRQRTVLAGDLTLNKETNTLYLSAWFRDDDSTWSTWVTAYDADTYLQLDHTLGNFVGKVFHDIFLDQNGEMYGIENGNIYHLNLETSNYIRVGNTSPVYQVAGYFTTEENENLTSPAALQLVPTQTNDITTADLVIIGKLQETQLVSLDFSGETDAFKISSDIALPLRINPGEKKLIPVVFHPTDESAFQSILTLTFSQGNTTWQEEVLIKGQGFEFTPITEQHFYGLRKGPFERAFLDKVNPETGKVESSTELGTHFEAMSANPHGEVFGMKQGKLFRIDPKSGGLLEVNTLWEDNTDLSSQRDLSATFDHNGNITLSNEVYDIFNSSGSSSRNDSFVQYLNYNLSEREFNNNIPLFGNQITFDVSEFTYYMIEDSQIYVHDLRNPVNLIIGQLSIEEESEITSLFVDNKSRLFSVIVTGTKTLLVEIDKETVDPVLQVELEWQYQEMIALPGEAKGDLIVTPIEKNPDASSIFLYPNPVQSSELLTVSGLNPSITQLKVHDLTGNLVAEINTDYKPEVEWRLQSTDLNPGIYIITFFDHEQKRALSKKLIIR